jgi:hypothetical protein
MGDAVGWPAPHLASYCQALTLAKQFDGSIRGDLVKRLLQSDNHDTLGLKRPHDSLGTRSAKGFDFAP